MKRLEEARLQNLPVDVAAEIRHLKDKLVSISIKLIGFKIYYHTFLQTAAITIIEQLYYIN